MVPCLREIDYEDGARDKYEDDPEEYDDEVKQEYEYEVSHYTSLLSFLIFLSQYAHPCFWGPHVTLSSLLTPGGTE